MHRWSLAVLAYSAVLTTCTVMDRLDHGQFASSDFCQSKSSVDNAGRFGAHHCMEHAAEWKSPGLWAKALFHSILPPLSTEARLIVGHLILSLSGWLNYAIGIGITVGAFFLWRNLWGAAPPQYTTKQAC